MKVTVLLADAAQSGVEGKVHALGLGWNVVGLPTPPQAIITVIELDREEAQEGHVYELEITLYGDDGEPVKAQTVEGSKADLGFKGVMTIGPAKFADVRSINSIAVNVGPGLPLEAGKRYEWRASVDGHHEPDWSAQFYIRLPESSD